jgi:hypothetical protein
MSLDQQGPARPEKLAAREVLSLGELSLSRAAPLDAGVFGAAERSGVHGPGQRRSRGLFRGAASGRGVPHEAGYSNTAASKKAALGPRTALF